MNRLNFFGLTVLLFGLTGIFSCSAPTATIETDVLVLGGGTGGTAAGIQAARSGARTMLVEPTPWLGGMLTAAGVSAVDGNHAMPAGLWGEFRDSLEVRYGGPQALATGWVSNTQFEPHVGATIFANVARAESALDLRLETQWTDIRREGDRWRVELEREGEKTVVLAEILIDGTDLGDVAAAAGATYDLGMDARGATGEAMAPETPNDIVQDLTFCAILQDYGEGADKTIARPENYDPAPFLCSCRQLCRDSSVNTHPCETMLTYGKLPGNKYMINWPIHGNDFYANVAEMAPAEREEIYAQAKAHTLAFVYFIQHELGYRHLGLAEGEFPTDDHLPLIPYHREGRRIAGLVRLDISHLVAPYEQDRPLYRTGIAVGDYPVDHHHDKNPDAPEIDFPPVPSFNVPLGALIPQEVSHLLVADKGISVTNIVNGSTRLQPVVLQIGQAAGLLAALAAERDVTPAAVPVREVQQALLDAGGYLMPYYDVPPDHPHFAAIQRVGAAGLLPGRGEPYHWANRTWFDPDTTVLQAALLADMQYWSPEFYASVRIDDRPLTFAGAWRMIGDFSRQQNLNSAAELPETEEAFAAWLSRQEDLTGAAPADLIRKGQLAVLIDRLLDPFAWPVGYDGLAL
jgi:hypothetical protein